MEYEALWVLRDVLSGEILLAKSLLSARQRDLAELLSMVKAASPVPITAVVLDRQHSIRKAVAEVFPGVPHQLCHFHFLREAARPIDEADRHAKKELKKKVRTVRGVERRTEGRDDREAEVIRGYCSAVRSALTDDGRPPLEASGLKLHARLTAIAGSLDRANRGRRVPTELMLLRGTIHRALVAAGGAFAPILRAFGWVHRAAHIVGQEDIGGATVRYQLSGLLGAIRQHRVAAGEFGGAVDHFLKVTRSYWPGLFACYDTPDLPRTNNDLEQLFGSHRYHERRATGRKGASPALPPRVPAPLVAGLGTRTGAGTVADLGGVDRTEWKRVRAELEERRQRRVERRRFRRDPEGHLKALENQHIQSRLLA